MKTAIIAPRSVLSRFATTGYHLVLAHWAQKSKPYRDYYRERAEAGDHIILDNSAHELGSGKDAQSLGRLFKQLLAKELILPDRLFFGDETVELSRRAYETLHKTVHPSHYVVVPQGRTVEEWAACLNQLFRYGRVVGISKDYEVWPGGLPELVARAQRICGVSLAGIHILGCPRDLGQLRVLSQMPIVRGIDSAKPLSMALEGRVFPSMYDWPLGGEASLYYPHRNGGFFDADERDFYGRIAFSNVLAFRIWAGDDSLSGV